MVLPCSQIARTIYSSSQPQGIFNATCTFSAFLCAISKDMEVTQMLIHIGLGLMKKSRKGVIVSLFLALPGSHSHSIMTRVLYMSISLLKIQIRDRAQDIPAIQLSNLLKGLYQAQPRLWPWDAQMQDTFPRFPGNKLALLSQISTSFPKNREGFYFLYLLCHKRGRCV